MFKVDPIDRQTIDSWPIAESGLPTRVVNGTREAGILSVGELRRKSDEELFRLRTIGRVSLRDIHNFFNLCQQIESGQLIFITIQQLFDLFLDKEEMTVLIGRCGLQRDDANASRNFMTLQEIGNTMHLTRERIRQVENTALAKLQSRLADVCLQPFYLYLRHFIHSRDQTVDYSEAYDLSGQAWLSDYNPCPVMLLLADLAPDKLTAYNRFFSILPRKTIETLERTAISVLKQESRSMSLDHIASRVASVAPDIPDISLRKAVRVILDYYPQSAPTMDNRYFLYPNGAHDFLTETMQSLSGPTGYRAITNAFNARLKPEGRKGAGYILKLLNEHPACARIDRGQYALQQAADATNSGPGDPAVPAP